MLSKYSQLFSVYLSRAFVYKFRGFIWVLNDAVAIFILPLVWLAAFGDSATIGGLTKQEIVTYYMVMGIVFIMVTPHPDTYVNQDIRDGKLSPWLIRPFSYFQHFLLAEIADRARKLITFVPLFLLVVWLYKDYFVFASLHRIFLILLISAVGFFAFFLLTFTIGLAGFWLEEARGVQHLYWFCILLFGGALAPLEFFPPLVQTAANLLPFQYFHSFPTKVYLNQLSGEEILYGCIALFVWFVAALLIYKTAWHFGVKKYSAVGG